MIDRISTTEKEHLQSLVRSVNKDITNQEYEDLSQKLKEIRSILPKDIPEPQAENPNYLPNTAKETLKQLTKTIDEYDLISTISRLAGDIAAQPTHHILTDNYWTSTEYGTQKDGNFWRDTDVVDSQVNRTYAQRHTNVFLNSLIIGSNTDIPKTADDRFSYMERTQKIATRLLDAIYLTHQLINASQTNSEPTMIANKISDLTKDFPPNTLESVLKSTIDLIAVIKPTENRKTDFTEKPEKNRITGQEYFAKYLEPVLPKLNEIYKREFSDTQTNESAVICLDRDARPLLHSLKAFVDNPCSFLPLLANNRQFHDELDFYADQIQNDILFTTSIFDTPKSWSQEVDRRLDEQNFPNLLYWRDVFGATLENSLKCKKKVLIIDIGYHGSTLEVVRYILSKAFPNISFVTAIAYQSDPDIPIQKAEVGYTHEAEHQVPKNTTGIEVKNGKLKYLQDTKSLLSNSQFYKEIIEATKAFKSKAN